MKIAICGTRGIPACYGGFETFAEELSTSLAASGYEVVVYCRSHLFGKGDKRVAAGLYKGVELRLLPTLGFKYLETPVHTLLSFLDLLFRRVDVVLLCNAVNSPLSLLLGFFSMPVAINVDGIERKRGKWGFFGRLCYRIGEIASVLFADVLICDAQCIADYYSHTYNRASRVLRYGYRAEPARTLELKLSGDFKALSVLLDGAMFEKWGIEVGKYILYVSRLEIENNAHRVIGAYNSLRERGEVAMPLVIVGDAPYAGAYIRELKRSAGEGVIFLGFCFGQSYRLLQLGAYLYVQATEVGGTHPALVEAMGYANCIVANSTPENREVLATSALYYPKNDVASLSALLASLLTDAPSVGRYREAAYRRALKHFSWQGIVDSYAKLFEEMAGDAANRAL